MMRTVWLVGLSASVLASAMTVRTAQACTAEDSLDAARKNKNSDSYRAAVDVAETVLDAEGVERTADTVAAAAGSFLVERYNRFAGDFSNTWADATVTYSGFKTWLDANLDREGRVHYGAERYPGRTYRTSGLRIIEGTRFFTPREHAIQHARETAGLGTSWLTTKSSGVPLLDSATRDAILAGRPVGAWLTYEAPAEPPAPAPSAPATPAPSTVEGPAPEPVEIIHHAG